MRFYWYLPINSGLGCTSEVRTVWAPEEFSLPRLQDGGFLRAKHRVDVRQMFGEPESGDTQVLKMDPAQPPQKTELPSPSGCRKSPVIQQEGDHPSRDKTGAAEQKCIESPPCARRREAARLTQGAPESVQVPSRQRKSRRGTENQMGSRSTSDLRTQVVFCG
ncbi:uncharacterized protein LOC105711376 isoform X3 [Aotus nancymaae]|uniref:uncharacterized protein LOC105711376 isoform X3 n=1 Tax=Aotus nancymaae TaxID=37293 RepID=UPI0030FEFBAB